MADKVPILTPINDSADCKCKQGPAKCSHSMGMAGDASSGGGGGGVQEPATLLAGLWATSPFAIRVHTALKLKGLLTYDKCDPVNKKVPVLIHDGKPVVYDDELLLPCDYGVNMVLDDDGRSFQRESYGSCWGSFKSVTTSKVLPPAESKYIIGTPSWLETRTDRFALWMASAPNHGTYMKNLVVPRTLVKPGSLILDSASPDHLVGEDIVLLDYKELVYTGFIYLADGTPLQALGVGSIVLEDMEFFIPNVYRIKGLRNSLISVSQLDRDHGLLTAFHGRSCEVLRRNGERVGAGHLQPNGMYTLQHLNIPQ